MGVLLLACLSGTPAASAASGDDASWFVQAGEGDRAVRNATFGVTHGYRPDWLSEDSRWSFYGEAAVGEWFIHRDDESKRLNFTQINLTPVVRFGDKRVFVEAGIGLAVIVPRFEDDGRRFGSKFNFDDHVAIGTRFGAARENELAVRLEHFSNGGIRNPNPGQNFVSLRFARRF